MAEAKKQPRAYRYRGANFLQRNRIKEMSLQGLDKETISNALNIDPKVVGCFMVKSEAPVEDWERPEAPTKKAKGKAPATKAE